MKKEKKCIVCGKMFTLNKYVNDRAKFCSIKCRSKDYYTKYYTHFEWKKERKCELCNQVFIPDSVGQKYCKEPCNPKIAYRLANRERDLKQRKECNKRRKDDTEKHNKDIECRRKWRMNNKDKRYSYKRAKRARKTGAGGSHTKDEWEELKFDYDYTCPCCGLFEPIIELTEDHIIPLTWGGDDYIENIQPLCKLCNSIKNNKTCKFYRTRKKRI